MSADKDREGEKEREIGSGRCQFRHSRVQWQAARPHNLMIVEAKDLGFTQFLGSLSCGLSHILQWTDFGRLNWSLAHSKDIVNMRTVHNSNLALFIRAIQRLAALSVFIVRTRCRFERVELALNWRWTKQFESSYDLGRLHSMLTMVFNTPTMFYHFFK